MRLKNSLARLMGLVLMAEAPSEGQPGGGASDPTPAPAPTGSVLGNAATDYIPEKYRTNKEDGSLDLEASSRKLAESYRHLETRLGSGDAPPKTFEEYAPKIEAEGFNWDEFKADESTQSFLKGAHAKGMTNAQVEYAISEYLKAAPALVEGVAQLTAQARTATLKAVWAHDAAMSAHVSATSRSPGVSATEALKPANFDA